MSEQHEEGDKPQEEVAVNTAPTDAIQNGGNPGESAHNVGSALDIATDQMSPEQLAEVRRALELRKSKEGVPVEARLLALELDMENLAVMVANVIKRNHLLTEDR